MDKAYVTPSVLRWARVTINLTIDEVAKRMHQKPETVVEWESGQDSPTYIKLEKLAYEVYKRPLAVFFYPEPPDEVGVQKSFRTLPEFEIKRFPSLLISIIRQGQAMQFKLAELCDGSNPAEKQIVKALSAAAIDSNSEDLAVGVRKYIEVPLTQQTSWLDAGKAFNEWRQALEKSGVFIFKEAFRHDEISGFCLYDSEFPIIYVNNTMARTRQIFTLFHELAHLLSQTGGIDKLSDDYVESLDDNERKVEILCNRFAAAFLVPEYDFLKQPELHKPDEEKITYLATRYSVSREVILRKLSDRGLIDKTLYDEMSQKWIEEAVRARVRGSGGDYYATKISYLGNNYLELVFSQYYRNRIDVYQLAEYLNAKVETALGIEVAFSH